MNYKESFVMTNIRSGVQTFHVIDLHNNEQVFQSADKANFFFAGAFDLHPDFDGSEESI